MANGGKMTRRDFVATTGIGCLLASAVPRRDLERLGACAQWVNELGRFPYIRKANRAVWGNDGKRHDAPLTLEWAGEGFLKWAGGDYVYVVLPRAL